MLNIVKINIEKIAVPQLFFRFTTTLKNAPGSYQLDKILQDHTPSLVAISDHNDLVLKLIRPRKIHEIVKLLWRHSRLSKEVNGNSRLAGLGLHVPEISEVGYALMPAKRYEYIGYYIMENLSQSGYEEVFELFHQTDLSIESRSKLFTAIYEGLLLMRDNNVVFSDFTLGNVFGDRKGKLIWIDTGVTSFSRLNQKKFEQKYNFAVRRFIKIHQELLLASEIQQAQSLLIE